MNTLAEQFHAAVDNVTDQQIDCQPFLGEVGDYPINRHRAT